LYQPNPRHTSRPWEGRRSVPPPHLHFRRSQEGEECLAVPGGQAAGRCSTLHRVIDLADRRSLVLANLDSPDNVELSEVVVRATQELVPFLYRRLLGPDFVAEGHRPMPQGGRRLPQASQRGPHRFDLPLTTRPPGVTG
jgi:hypothetical protein